MWCPKCKSEFRDGITICPVCSIALTSRLPIEVDPSPAQEKVKMLNHVDGRENLQSLSDGNHAYVEKSTKYDDMKSTAYSFLLVGAGGILLLILALAGVIPVQFAAYMKGLMGIVMGSMFLIFFVIGLRSYMQLGSLKEQVLKEQREMDAAIKWFHDSYSAKAIDVSLDIHEADDMQKKYFQRSSYMKRLLHSQFPDYDDSFLDYLTELFYDELFGHEE